MPATLDAKKTKGEMTTIDGNDRTNAEVILDSEQDAEDWTAERDAAGADALQAVVAQMVAEQVAAQREQIKQEATAAAMQAMAKQMARADDKPSLTMMAKVHDRFITQSNSGQPGATNTAWLKHYRCETAVSTKMTEIDMTLLDKYMSGELDRPTDDKNRPYSDGRILNLCEIAGQYIVWVEGHCYCFTPNQVRNVERVMQLAELGLQGGMAGIYEDHGGAAWACQVCPSRPSFLDERTWRGHMTAVHNVAPAALG